MNTHAKKIIVTTLLLASLVPALSFASEIRVDASKTEVRTGEELVVSVIAHTDTQINALEGQVTFADDILKVEEIRNGNSVVNFWIEEPRVRTPGAVSFSGITPGGWIGANQQIFSIVFVAKEVGLASITLQNIIALQNDGNATKLALSIHPASVVVKPGDSTVRKESFEDVEPPEDFTPSIASDPSIYDGKYFLVFATQDKGSGINRYEVREGSWGWFKKAESPYLLAVQHLDKDLYVKAIDGAGNERIAVVPARVHSSWRERYGLFVILIMIVVGLLFTKPWSRFTPLEK